MKWAVVVTGASGGIGRACVSRLMASGFTVLAAVRTEAQAASIPAGAMLFRLDLSHPAQIDEVAEVIRSFELPLRGLVNNAGMPRAGSIEDLPMPAIREVLQVNLLGPVRRTRLLLPDLRRAKGRIVNIGSGEGFLATPLNAPYCMAKPALESLSESLGLELAASGVPVSVVSPGQTETPILHAARAPSEGCAADRLHRTAITAAQHLGIARFTAFSPVSGARKRGTPISQLLKIDSSRFGWQRRGESRPYCA